MPFWLMSFLNSAIQIIPNTKNKAIKACCDCKDIKNNTAYSTPEIALTISSFTWLG